MFELVMSRASFCCFVLKSCRLLPVLLILVKLQLKKKKDMAFSPLGIIHIYRP